MSLAPALADGILFYGTTYLTARVAMNGNLNLSGNAVPNYIEDVPLIAPAFIGAWYADVDTRTVLPDGRNRVYWAVTSDRMVITYFDVGRFNARVDLLNSFQIILTDARAAGAPRDFDVELRYARCEWTTADASGPVAPLAGFNAGDGVNGYALPGSRTPAVVNLCTTSNVGMPGVWRFRFRGGLIDGACGDGVVDLGEQCDDGNVLGGDACTRSCRLPPPIGLTCAIDDDCHSGFCTDGVCCESRCEAQCERCNAAASLGSCVPTSGAPVGGREACLGVAPCGGACDGTGRTGCTYPGASVSCDDGTFCTQADACDGGGTCASGAARTCDDADACTADSCIESSAVCSNTYGGGCSIGGTCIAPGGIDPGSPCRACQPAISRVTYTLRDVGSTCDDGAFCTVGESCDALGACGGGGANDCDDGLACTTDLCSEAVDTCETTLAVGCLIEGACIDAGALDTADGCAWCDPSVDASRYVDIDGCEADAGAPLDAATIDASAADASSPGADAGFDAGPPAMEGPGCACTVEPRRTLDCNALVMAALLVGTWIVRRRQRRGGASQPGEARAVR